MVKLRPVYVVALFAIGLLAIVSGAYNLQQNMNRGRYIGGHGYLMVRSCSGAGSYTCVGQLRQYGGMIVVNEATIRSSKALPNDEAIEDIYAKYGRGADGELRATLMTGAERRSLVHNAPNIAAIVLGSALAIGTVVFRQKERKVSR
jgi:hypothetical protein